MKKSEELQRRLDDYKKSLSHADPITYTNNDDAYISYLNHLIIQATGIERNLEGLQD